MKKIMIAFWSAFLLTIFASASYADQYIRQDTTFTGVVNFTNKSHTTSARLFHSGGIPARTSTDGTNATPVITEVYIAEVFVPATTEITGVSIFNGAAVTDDMKVGLADGDGTVIAEDTSGVTQAGTDAYQRAPFDNPVVVSGPATYYVLLKFDGTTSRFNAHAFGDFGAAKQTGQTYAAAFASITPPTTFTADLGPIASLY